MIDPFITMVDLLNSKIQELQDKINEKEDVEFVLRGRVSDLESENASLLATNRTIRADVKYHMDMHDYWRKQYNQHIESLQKPIPTQEEALAKANAYLLTDEYKGHAKSNRRINCIKAVRELTHWGLKEAKEWTDKAFKEYPEGKPAESLPDPCPTCGEDRNHPSQHGKHSC